MDTAVKNRAGMVLRTACILTLVLVMQGCDLFEDDGDWENSVTVRVQNESVCLVTLYLDGINQTSMEPGEDFEKNDVNQGNHLLEAYPWNDSQFSCDHVFTEYLNAGQTFEWRITNDGGCGDCPPTPTPAPGTPTPTPTEDA